MGIRAIVFGGIGTLVETSELQRRAFNDAFSSFGVHWNWDRKTYRHLLSVPGGRNRIRHYRATQAADTIFPENLVRSVHERKTELFQEALASSRPLARPGVRNLINKAKNTDVRVAIASTTVRSNLFTLIETSDLDPDFFDVILDKESVDSPKPHPAVYFRCLELLGIPAANAVAIEDSDSGVQAALAAGLTCIAVPGENTADQDFSRAALVVNDGNDLEQGVMTSTVAGLDLKSCHELVASIR